MPKLKKFIMLKNMKIKKEEIFVNMFKTYKLSKKKRKSFNEGINDLR